jgi:hypothetical protein
VIIDDRHVVGVAIPPSETDPPLIVDANAVLPGPITAQLLQAVSGRDAKIIQDLRRVDRNKLPEHNPSQLGRVTADRLARKEALGITVAEALDHWPMLTRHVTNVKRYQPVI